LESWSSGFSQPGVSRLRRRPEPASRLKTELQRPPVFLGKEIRGLTPAYAPRLASRGTPTNSSFPRSAASP